jgi:PXPV repeat (3 copies)
LTVHRVFPCIALAFNKGMGSRFRPYQQEITMKFSSVLAKAAAVALALAAAGTATVAQARSDVYFSIGANVAPGVVFGASNYAPVYVAPPPVYVQPAPVYYGYNYAAPVYVRPAPIYYGPPARVYYGARHHRHGGKYYNRGHGQRRHGGYGR